MKKLLLLTLTAIFAFNQTNAQFNSVTNCGAQGVGHSIFFVNADTGFVAGEAFGFGVIQKTMDGGNTWTNVYTSTAGLEWVEDIYFVNATNGIAVGLNGTILQTTNGGVNWNRQTILNVNRFNAVYFPTAAVGYAAGYGNLQGQIYKTIDGGLNWTPKVCYADSSLRSVFFLNADTGYAVGNYDIVKTTDGGASWIKNKLNYQDHGSQDHLEMYCTNDSTCYIPFNGIQKTTNSGITWNAPSLPLLTPPYAYFIIAINFTNSLTGFAVGAKADTSNFTTFTGTIFKSIDGGSTWNNINTPANDSALQQKLLESIKFVNAEVGYTSGTAEIVLKTTNAGGLTGMVSVNNNIANEMNIYPNPFSSFTTLHTDNIFKDATLTVFNFMGQQIKQIKNLAGHTITFYRDNLPIGMYFLQLTQDNKTITTGKLIITD